MKDYIFLDTCELERSGFCTGCAGVEDESEINFESCQTGWDMCDENCLRYSDVQEIVEVVAKLNKRLHKICSDNRRLGDSWGME